MRSLADLHRALARMLVRPVLSPSVPLRLQRVWLGLLARAMFVPAGVSVRAARIGGVAAERLAAGSARRTILYFHGGGYCIGSPATVRNITARLARSCQAEVLAVDYRLAPEHPYPAALEDALAAYQGLLGGGIGPGEIVLAGDSAGGGIALATAIRLRELGLALPAALVLLAPWVDLAPVAATRAEPILTPAWLDFCARQYLGDQEPKRASPVHAALGGLPRTLIQVGGDDVLCAQAARLADRMREAGTSVALDVRPGLWHVFQLQAGALAAADAALADVAAFIAGGL